MLMAAGGGGGRFLAICFLSSHPDSRASPADGSLASEIFGSFATAPLSHKILKRSSNTRFNYSNTTPAIMKLFTLIALAAVGSSSAFMAGPAFPVRTVSQLLMI
jgi:hypothetical protein